MRFQTDGTVLRDQHGRQRILHGINLVAKGNQNPNGNFIDRGFKGAWTPQDITDLAARGFTLIRLGVMWAAVEPEPGEYDQEYLDWVGEQLDLIHGAGMFALLDSHQDLYSQTYGDGAPGWATLSPQEFEATEMWSDAYLSSPALHESLDLFWANAPGPGGVGVQDRFAAMWSHVAKCFADHPALLGYDLLNEPAPGSSAPEIFMTLIGAFAQITGQDSEQVFADFDDPETKFAQLGLLEDVGVHRQVGDAVHPMVEAFETDFVAPFMAKVAGAVREADQTNIIAREHSYFANLGVPSGQPVLPDHAWVYSPHGYDLTVDTPAIALSSNTRAATIFARHRETQDRLNVPVIVGEWGALDLGPGITPHGRFLADLFDSFGWSWTYWCWQEGFSESEAAKVLTRPRPIAFAGTATSYQVINGLLQAKWHGAETAEPSVFYIPGAGEKVEVTVHKDGEEIGPTINGPWVEVSGATGDFLLSSR